jgi:Uma2 family endonuclease
MSALAVSDRLLTTDEFYELEDSVAYELGDGVLEERPVSVDSSEIGATFVAEIGGFARRNGLGKAYGADLGLQIFPGRPRRIPRADCVFVSHERLTGIAPEAPYLTVTPSLLVEVVSPSERAARTDRKVQEYIEAGVLLVWVVYPETERVMVYRADGTTELVPRDGVLQGENVLPGFALPLKDLFAEA